MADPKKKATRVEKDTLGAMQVPADVLYGAQTARAVENFPISGWTLPPRFLASLARIKVAFARANVEAGLLDSAAGEAIAAAAGEVAAGKHDREFPVDVFQTGSGTSTNMNMNEVVARLANERLGREPGSEGAVHPNDHVNLGQSSNDTVPAALRLATAAAWQSDLEPALESVSGELARLAEEHEKTVTLGRTHLMDAVPTTYGRIFDAWRRRLGDAAERAEAAAERLAFLPLGGTAVGTGIGGRGSTAERAVQLLAEALGIPLFVMENPAVGIAAQDAPIAFADAAAGIGRVLFSIANDLRLRGSGPFGGLGELKLPAVQPGSSIMPGKVNPVIPEAVAQAALQVEGLATTCRASATLHQLDLSHANPLLAWNLDTMIRLLSAACRVLVEKCLRELEVDVERARAHAAASPAMATALARRLGYEKAAEVAKAAEAAGESVAEAARRLQILPEEELEELLDLDRMARPPGETQG